MSEHLKKTGDGSVLSAEGWAVRFLGPELIEYCTGPAACLVNVGYCTNRRARQIYATESLSDLFPNLREHLQSVTPLFQGHYVVV